MWICLIGRIFNRGLPTKAAKWVNCSAESRNLPQWSRKVNLKYRNQNLPLCSLCHKVKLCKTVQQQGKTLWAPHLLASLHFLPCRLENENTFRKYFSDISSCSWSIHVAKGEKRNDNKGLQSTQCACLHLDGRIDNVYGWIAAAPCFLQRTYTFDSPSFAQRKIEIWKNSPKKKTGSLGQFQYKRERERQYELVRSDWLATLHLLERHPSSRRSADTVLPFLFQPAHSYTDLITPATDLLSSAGRIYCQNSQPISQSVDHCRAESGNVHLRWQ